MKAAFFNAAIAAALAGCAAPVCSVPGTAVPGIPEQVGENVTEARAILARPTPNGGLSLPGLDIGIGAYVPGWTGIPIKANWAKAGESGATEFEIRGRDDGLVRFRGSSEWKQREDGSLAGHIELECVAEVQVQCLTLSFSHPAPPRWGCGDGERAVFDFSLEDGRVVHLSASKPMSYHSQDSHQWGGKFTTRIGGHLGTGDGGGIRTFTPGDRLVWDVTLSSPDGIAFSDYKPLTISENENWVRLDYKKDVVPGSALDFSGMGFQDAPAGKYGWLEAIGGHFEFEGLPGVEQRFYGVNLCFSANYPEHEMADRLVERFVRCGYNTIRVHHHDGMWAKNENGARDKLDYLLARCYAAGLYVTTDLYVSRPVAWREIGIDRDGNMEKQLYKTYVGLHEGAFSNWCENARAFLEHVNPYTGRANKDEPGMPLIALVNEGKLHMAWTGAQKAKDPVVREAWKRYCEERVAVARGSGAEPPSFVDEPPPPGSADYADPHHQFDEWVNRRVWERGSAFVRSLGCRALLTNDNNGRWHGEGEGLTPLYDYVDSHFYVDHPAFLEKQWKLPSRCSNANPIRNELPAILHRGYAKGSAKPYAITEWNFSGPGKYRAMGGILTGALASEQDWDGLWRFAYSHNRDNFNDGAGGPGYFDCVTDPLIAASDRASVCLFLGAGRDGPARRVYRGAMASSPALRLDTVRGTMVLDTPLVCGGFAEGGRIDAGPLSFDIRGGTAAPEEVNALATQLDKSSPSGSTSAGGTAVVPATLWVTSLDGAPVAESSRLLLTHLTDVQGEGARYADATRRILLAWGRKPLVEVGAADVELRLAETSPDAGSAATPPTVWSLDTSGRRIAEVPSAVRDGALCFRVSTDGPAGGRIYYEIVRP